MLDHEDIYQQSFSIATAETRNKCSLPGLEHQVSWNKEEEVLDYSVVFLASNNMSYLCSQRTKYDVFIPHKWSYSLKKFRSLVIPHNF